MRLFCLFVSVVLVPLHIFSSSFLNDYLKEVILKFRNAFIHRLKGSGEHKRGTVLKGSEPKKDHGTHSGFLLIHFVQNQCLEVVNTPPSALPVCAQQCHSVSVTS